MNTPNSPFHKFTIYSSVLFELFSESIKSLFGIYYIFIILYVFLCTSITLIWPLNNFWWSIVILSLVSLPHIAFVFRILEKDRPKYIMFLGIVVALGILCLAIYIVNNINISRFYTTSVSLFNKLNSDPQATANYFSQLVTVFIYFYVLTFFYAAILHLADLTTTLGRIQQKSGMKNILLKKQLQDSERKIIDLEEELNKLRTKEVEIRSKIEQ